MDTNRYPEWNARPRMTPNEFAEWQAAWHAREQSERYGLQMVTQKIVGRIHDELIVDASEMRLGTDFDKWFLGQLKSSAEGL
jgi:hypothetical protein